MTTVLLRLITELFAIINLLPEPILKLPPFNQSVPGIVRVNGALVTAPKGAVAISDGAIETL